MALRVPTRQEVGQRVRWLRKQTPLAGRDLAALIGVTDTGIMTKIEKHGLSFDFERLMDIANALAGRGQLINDPDALYDFMMGRKDKSEVLRPNFRLVEADDEAIDSTTKGSDIPRPLNSLEGIAA